MKGGRYQGAGNVLSRGGTRGPVLWIRVVGRVGGEDKGGGGNSCRSLLQNHPFGLSEVLRISYITVGVFVQVVDVGLINHLIHLGGGEHSIIKVIFNFDPYNTQ